MSPEAVQSPQGRCCPAAWVSPHLPLPGLNRGVSPSLLNPCRRSPALWCVLAVTKQEEHRDTPASCASHQLLLRLGLSAAGTGAACPVLLYPPGSSRSLAMAGVGTVGQPTAKPARALAAPTVAPAVADFMSRAPLSQDLAVFPSQATSSHCPGPAECKTSRAQGKRRFPGAPLPSEGLQPLQHGQLAHPGQHEPGPGRRPLPTGPGQGGDVHWGRLAGSWPWPPVPGGALSCSVW